MVSEQYGQYSSKIGRTLTKRKIIAEAMAGKTPEPIWSPRSQNWTPNMIEKAEARTAAQGW